MLHNRPPTQRCLFAPDAAETIAGLAKWSDADLLHLVRAAAYELIHRDLPLPLAVPVVQAAYAAIGADAAV
jgi:hypothetical protein